MELDKEALEKARLAAREAIAGTIGQPVDATPILARAALPAKTEDEE